MIALAVGFDESAAPSRAALFGLHFELSQHGGRQALATVLCHKNQMVVKCVNAMM